MKSMDLGCGVGSGRNSEDVFYVSAALHKATNLCKVDSLKMVYLINQKHSSSEIQSQPTVNVRANAFVRLLFTLYVLTVYVNNQELNVTYLTLFLR